MAEEITSNILIAVLLSRNNLINFKRKLINLSKKGLTKYQSMGSAYQLPIDWLDLLFANDESTGKELIINRQSDLI